VSWSTNTSHHTWKDRYVDIEKERERGRGRETEKEGEKGRVEERDREEGRERIIIIFMSLLRCILFDECISHEIMLTIKNINKMK
jgi:hypothetical protein